MKNTPKAAKKYYFAYGSNTNLKQMAHRCPRAATVGAVALPDYTLIFNGVASIKKRNGSAVDGLLWEITPNCERSLDIYEGYPRLYTKRTVTVCANDGTKYKAMVYIMTPEYDSPRLPDDRYYAGIYEGFLQNGIPTHTLKSALDETRAEVEKAAENRKYIKRGI